VAEGSIRIDKHEHSVNGEIGMKKTAGIIGLALAGDSLLF